MLFSNNVNLRPGEQYAFDAIQQQLLSAVLGFGVATSASGLHLCLWPSRSNSSSNKNNKNPCNHRSDLGANAQLVLPAGWSHTEPWAPYFLGQGPRYFCQLGTHYWDALSSDVHIIKLCISIGPFHPLFMYSSRLVNKVQSEPQMPFDEIKSSSQKHRLLQQLLPY
ncbi:hypothetical protein DPMN_169089 [Dreissena polymorpha]|uniref:Uncharacterized protein n=1 Tax=Dreissena polymorpha TaxID=45954 RepID=A0A9D4IWJ0_DREPO|nr:hypothetical protein DPMN_169089 [Dreissena polymorpha]